MKGRRLPYKNKFQRIAMSVLDFLTFIFVNAVSMLTLIGATILIILSVYFLFTENLIKFSLSVILLLTFVYVNKS